MDVIFLTFIKIEKIVVKHCPDDNCNRPVLIGTVGQIISYGLVTFIKIEKIVVKHCPDDNCNRPILIGPVGQIISYGLVTFRKKDTMRICNQVNINVYRSISSILVVQISREAQCWTK